MLKRSQNDVGHPREHSGHTRNAGQHLDFEPPEALLKTQVISQSNNNNNILQRYENIINKDSHSTKIGQSPVVEGPKKVAKRRFNSQNTVGSAYSSNLAHMFKDQKKASPGTKGEILPPMSTQGVSVGG